MDRIKSTNDDNYFPNTTNFARRFSSTLKLCMTTACGITDPPNAAHPVTNPAQAAGVRLYRQPDDTGLFRLGGGDPVADEKFVALFDQMFPPAMVEREMKRSHRVMGGANKTMIMPRRMLVFR